MKKKVFISGITGTMGSASLKHLLDYKDVLDLVTIVRDTDRNKKKMESFKDSINIIWGDLREYEDVKRALKDVDYIIHVAALVSPKADRFPQKAWDINVGSIENILRAIEELGLVDVKLVYIGTVAETGSRLTPIHWGRVGDPINPSKYDTYALTKIAAERRVIESGLKYWVSLRQTGILHPGLLNSRDGIMFHQPLRNVLEWITDDDSGRLIANLCTKGLPETFWKKIYNVGGGESCRANNYQLTSMLMNSLGVKDIKSIFEPNWFALKNFHGQYYLDSDLLNDILDFRSESIEDFAIRLKKTISFPTSLTKYIPDSFIKHFIMKPVAESKDCTIQWIETRNTEKIDAYWGSIENWKRIDDWDSINLNYDYSKSIILDHGYDEEKDESSLDMEDMKKAAKFRGGGCLSASMEVGNLDNKLEWRCASEHTFHASPRLVLKAGHWCEKCISSFEDNENQSNKNLFLAQVKHGEELF